MRTHALRLLAAAAAATLAASTAHAQTCSATSAPRGLFGSSYLDAMLNKLDGEDNDFFTTTQSSGLPNLFILLGNSRSMLRLPPNGPSTYGTYPPLRDMGTCSGLGDERDPACANTALADPFTTDWAPGQAVVGCGLDDVSRPYDVTGSAINFLATRGFYPACGLSVTAACLFAPYSSACDYAHEASTCPRLMQGSSGTITKTTGSDGYDPDWYCGSGDVRSCTGQKPNLFDKDLVFHDTIGDPTLVVGDGWSDTAVSPEMRTASQEATVSDFCSRYGTRRQGTLLKSDICTQCLGTRGFFLDGRMFRANQDGRTATPATGYASIFFKGNYLNFYPPKFVVARKVMKDVIADFRKMRVGIAHFSDTGADHTNGQWEDMKPSCQMSDTSNFDAFRKTYADTVDRFPFSLDAAPLSRALLDIGQYYHTPALSWFSSTWPATWNGDANFNQASICYSCQANNVLVITDGGPRGSVLPQGTVTADQVENLYAGGSPVGSLAAAAGHGIAPTISGTARSGGIPTTLCPRCEDFGVDKDVLNNPTRVAWYLQNMDLRSNSEFLSDRTSDCTGMGGKQRLNVYAVGFGIREDEDTRRSLSDMASMGGGMSFSAQSAPALKAAIGSVLQEIDDRSTSFSVATVSTLQTTSGRSVIIPRFSPAKRDPARSSAWEGHLVRYELYSEFVNGCVETPDGSGAGDLDCDGKCSSVFLQDSEGSFIQEDGSGTFVKNVPNVPACSQASRCQGTKGCAPPGTGNAVPWWDAGTKLKQQEWRTQRRVYTQIDRNGDGKIDGDDGGVGTFGAPLLLEVDDDVVANRLAPYLPLRKRTATELSTCETIAQKVFDKGDAATANAIATNRLFCVKTIIRYVLGADVLNEADRVSPDWPKPATDAGQNALLDRPFKLGDIFHSSPVVVDPPLPSDGILCPNGLHNQCINSLWATPVLHSPSANEYDAYAKSSRYKDRRKVILVGGNDGMLHAIDGGKWHAATYPGDPDGDDPVTPYDPVTQVGLNESLPPFNGFYDRGSGRELWGFIPPDLLSKLPLMLTKEHQLFVDGSPMVRDIWADGSTNGLPCPGPDCGVKDGKKESWEFHTIAVVGERRGGKHYFALDVTDATFLPDEPGFAAPRFLWISPQPSARALASGETYTDFLPVGPPIGPIRIQADAVSGAAFPSVSPSMQVGSGPVQYHERWVAFLAGGLDPQYLRGRGVYMVDAYTGEEIFDFAQPPNPDSLPAGDVRRNLRAPIPATVGMVMWGPTERRTQVFENDGYFDTATFGDTAGQIWVLRFSAPGQLSSSTNKVTNWYGGRVFEMTGCSAQPFFYITANVAIHGGAYRVLAGTGDRMNLLDTNGGTCGPDNPRACIQRGCSVTLDQTANAFTAAVLGGEQRGTNETASCGSFTQSGDSASPASCAVNGSAKMVISCSSTTSTTKQIAVTCDATSGEDYGCTQSATSWGSPLTLSDTTNAITQKNWFFSLRVFDDTGARMIFKDAAGAAAYDTARLTLSSPTAHTTGLVVIDAASTTPPTASATSPGWAMYYDHGPTVTVDEHDYPVNPLDERTSSTTAIFGGAFWNTTQPSTGAVTRTSNTCAKVALCTAENRRLAYHYGADVTSGAFVLKDENGDLIRSKESNTLVPPTGDQPTVFVNQKGQVQVGLTAVNPEKGATNVARGEVLDPTSDYGFLEVSHGVHACRHSPPATAPTACMP